MSYSSPRYDARPLVTAAFNASFGTATGAAVNASPSVAFPSFARKSKVNAVKFTVLTVPNNAATNLKANLMNGTSTFATVALTTATAGQILNGTVSAAYNTFSADTRPTVTVTGTATASGDALGAYTIAFEVQEVFE